MHIVGDCRLRLLVDTCEGPIGFSGILWISSTEVNPVDSLYAFIMPIRSGKCARFIYRMTVRPCQWYRGAILSKSIEMLCFSLIPWNSDVRSYCWCFCRQMLCKIQSLDIGWSSNICQSFSRFQESLDSMKIAGIWLWFLSYNIFSNKWNDNSFDLHFDIKKIIY